MWRIKAFSSGPYKPGDRKTEDSALKHTSYSASKRDTERWGCEAGLEIKLAAEKTSCLEHIWRSGPLNNELINIANPNSSGGMCSYPFLHTHKEEDVLRLSLSYPQHIVPSRPGAVWTNWSFCRKRFSLFYWELMSSFSCLTLENPEMNTWPCWQVVIHKARRCINALSTVYCKQGNAIWELHKKPSLRQHNKQPPKAGRASDFSGKHFSSSCDTPHFRWKTSQYQQHD